MKRANKSFNLEINRRLRLQYTSIWTRTVSLVNEVPRFIAKHEISYKVQKITGNYQQFRMNLGMLKSISSISRNDISWRMIRANSPLRTSI